MIGIVTWLLSFLSGPIIDKAVTALGKSGDIRVQEKQIDADVIKDAMKYYVESQKVESAKYQIPWFWIAAAPLLTAVGVYFVTLTAYNIFWHSEGVFPQTWSIAAYPGPYQEWATTVFNWIFAPALGAATLQKIFGRK